jgi:membrane glycosyltransferase
LCLSTQPKPANAKTTSYTGIFLLVFAVLVVVLDFANFFAIAISFFSMLIGIILVMVGARGGFEKKPEAAPLHTEALREILKVR